MGYFKNLSIGGTLGEEYAHIPLDTTDLLRATTSPAMGDNVQYASNVPQRATAQPESAEKHTTTCPECGKENNRVRECCNRCYAVLLENIPRTEGDGICTTCKSPESYPGGAEPEEEAMGIKCVCTWCGTPWQEGQISIDDVEADYWAREDLANQLHDERMREIDP